MWMQLVFLPVGGSSVVQFRFTRHTKLNIPSLDLAKYPNTFYTHESWQMILKHIQLFFFIDFFILGLVRSSVKHFQMWCNWQQAADHQFRKWLWARPCFQILLSSTHKIISSLVSCISCHSSSANTHWTIQPFRIYLHFSNTDSYICMMWRSLFKMTLSYDSHRHTVFCLSLKLAQSWFHINATVMHQKATRIFFRVKGQVHNFSNAS